MKPQDELASLRAQLISVKAENERFKVRNVQAAAEIDMLNGQLTHLRAESLRLASANDALEKERDGLREQVADQAQRIIALVESPAGDLKSTREQLQSANRYINEVEKELSTAQAAEARLREENHRLHMAYVDQVIAIPPTAALPDGEDTALLNWSYQRKNAGRVTYDMARDVWIVDGDPLNHHENPRAAIRAASTGATK